MNLRDALVQQSPSLALQRAAQEEIASLDRRLKLLLEYMDTFDLWEHYFQWRDSE